MLDVDSSDSKIIAFIEEWVNDLVNEDYESAYNRTSHDPFYEWTPELIKEVINGYGHPEPHPCGEVYKVTSMSAAKGKNPAKSVDRVTLDDNCFGYAYYDLPLNGEWSDLTAIFRLEKREASLVVILEQIHVM